MATIIVILDADRNPQNTLAQEYFERYELLDENTVRIIEIEEVYENRIDKNPIVFEIEPNNKKQFETIKEWSK